MAIIKCKGLGSEECNEETTSTTHLCPRHEKQMEERLKYIEDSLKKAK